MNYEELSMIEKTVLKLTYCKGIGLIGKWKIVKFYEKFQAENFFVEDVIQIAQINRYKGMFRQSFREISDDWLKEKLQDQQYVTWLSSDYPAELLELPYPPLVIFYRGNLDLLDYPRLAFVGARQASKYSTQVISKLLPTIVKRQFVIVSGLAKGVDRMSHEMTIRSGGLTIGVVGCGLDICYPREVSALFGEMKKNHLVLSEYPQGTPIQKNHFPMRNRIIAGLSKATCVIEAKERSGSLITAQLALDYGKEVFAIPGEILTGQSDGCHRLIQDGAKCVVSVQDILEELPNF
ncbi:DNA-processing protein DprA [Tetragenococcus halophilus]|uniref:DNA processing protein n=1 Tax=Tetragenococcus halophilus subsp. halophilus TaxID=1513897 RepID=A0A2H6C0P1_TETHA|nr:DNA-processing protein DprA [Tetragenococcus halophilus]MCO8291560.1 DNA-protecting protein DprA [Tetragenococcus halophilus]MCO8296108.1 DNA-protecting protein DprA [Tetragenococcus halophilus]MDN5832097.1 DNA-processing protein DprA [Tetragenococcus halophilus]MDN6112578.1 DNA-processing protein DprA [Tetragenococcus halophilus]MDN6129748.1 DNA-processing protein DprA [Tetragenococcus halophilus]